MYEKLINNLIKIPHCTFAMNYAERISYLNRIKNYILEIKEKINKNSKVIDPNDKLLNYNIPVFMLAYYGVNVRDIIQEYNSLYKLIFRNKINEINSIYSCKRKYNKPYKKILFCSGRLAAPSSVLNSTLNIIKHLSSKNNFYVDVLTKKIKIENFKNNYKNCKNVFEKENALECIDIIGGGRYDAVIYPDMNMDSLNSCLGLFRLAPIQINTFGHSETSGSADYFISSKFYEHEKSQDNYSEKLIQFDSLALDYPDYSKNNKTEFSLDRNYFQIPKHSNVYYCNSSFFKFGKEFFYIIDKILEKDEKAIVVLTKLSNPMWDVNFYNFLEKNISENNINRVRFLNRLNSYENNCMMNISDVYIESYPFGNMNSTLECFKLGLPVLSIPTSKLNNRFTYGFYKKMNLEKEYCFTKFDDYIDKAIQMANNKNKNIKEEIKEKSKILFEEKESSIEWENFLLELL